MQVGDESLESEPLLDAQLKVKADFERHWVSEIQAAY
jgi:hypothetical protein